MAEILITSRTLPSRPGAWRGIERYEIWPCATDLIEDNPYNERAGMTRWCEVSFHKPSNGPVTMGFHGRNRRVIPIESIEIIQ